MASPAAQWIYTDHLGSPRLRANASGAETSRHWYYPYGEEFQPPVNPVIFRYNAKERDAETGMQDYGARYYDTLMGRFSAADPARESGVVENPQTWNRYAYAIDSPLVYVDIDGQIPMAALGAGHLFDIKREKEKIRNWLKRQEPAVTMIGGVLLDAIVPDSNEELAAAIILGAVGKGLGAFGDDIVKLVDDVIKSGLRPARAGVETARALQALQKKIDRGDVAFRGLSKDLGTANEIIRKTLSATDRIVRYGKNRNGVPIVDIFDPATGRGVRLILSTGEFDTFVNL